MEEQLKQLNERLTKIERQLGGLSNDPRQIKVIQNAFTNEGVRVGKLGLDKTPVGRQATISDPTGGIVIDSQSRVAIGDIIDVLQAFGLIS